MKNFKIKYMSKLIIAISIILLVLPFLTDGLMAQPAPPPPPPPPPAGIPIDGGLALLLAGLGAYGVRKIWNKK